MMIVSEQTHFFELILGFDIISIPINNVILICLTKLMQSVNLVFYDLFTGATFKIINPSFCDVKTLFYRFIKHAVMSRIWVRNGIVYGNSSNDHKKQHSINFSHYYCTFSKFEMINL